MLGIKLRTTIWLLGSASKLSLENKIIIYKAMMKPVWTYCIQLWGSAAVTIIAILQRFQSTIRPTITNAPWYVTNNQLHNDLDLLSVEEEIKRYSSNYIDRLKLIYYTSDTFVFIYIFSYILLILINLYFNIKKSTF